MAAWIKAIGRVIPPGPPGQRRQPGRAGRPGPGVASSRVRHDQVEPGARDAAGDSGIRPRRPGQGPDPGFRQQAGNHLRSQAEFRHPGYVRSRRAVKDGLPEGCRGRQVADIQDQMHGADHVTDDSRTHPRAPLVNKRLPPLPRTEMPDLRRVGHAAELVPSRTKSALGSLA